MSFAVHPLWKSCKFEAQWSGFGEKNNCNFTRRWQWKRSVRVKMEKRDLVRVAESADALQNRTAHHEGIVCENWILSPLEDLKRELKTQLPWKHATTFAVTPTIPRWSRFDFSPIADSRKGSEKETKINRRMSLTDKKRKKEFFFYSLMMTLSKREKLEVKRKAKMTFERNFFNWIAAIFNF